MLTMEQKQFDLTKMSEENGRFAKATRAADTASSQHRIAARPVSWKRKHVLESRESRESRKSRKCGKSSKQDCIISLQPSKKDEAHYHERRDPARVGVSLLDLCLSRLAR